MTRSNARTGPSRSVTFRLGLDLYEELNRLAEDDQRSLNGVVVVLLRDALNNRQEKANG